MFRRGYASGRAYLWKPFKPFTRSIKYCRTHGYASTLDIAKFRSEFRIFSPFHDLFAAHNYEYTLLDEHYSTTSSLAYPSVYSSSYDCIGYRDLPVSTTASTIPQPKEQGRSPPNNSSQLHNDAQLINEPLRFSSFGASRGTK
jgi:hypothetical protein